MTKKQKNYTLSDLKKELLQDEEFAREYKKEQILNDIAYKVFQARQKRGLTQGELADIIGTKQSSISRLERTLNKNLPSLEFLYKISDALEVDLEVNFL